MRRRKNSYENPPIATHTPTIKIPHDVVNEQLLILAAITDWNGRGGAMVGTVQTDFFHGGGHAEIWSALEKMKSEKLSFDLGTVEQISGKRADIKYLEQLIASRTDIPPNLKHHLAVLRWDHARIATAEGPVSAFLEALRDPMCDAERVRALAKAIGEGLGGYGSAKYLRDSQEIKREVRARLSDRKKAKGIYPFGIPGLDYYAEGDYNIERSGERVSLAGKPRVSPGAAPGQVSVITAVPGSGKTTFICNMISGLYEQKRRVLVGAWEQSSSCTLEQIAAIRLGFTRDDITQGNYTEEDEEEIGIECEKLTEYVRFFELPFGKARGEKQYNDKNMDLIQQVVADSGCSIFIADLFRRALKETNPDDEEQALYRMQAMAMEQRIHLCLAQQQKAKEVENSADKRPSRDTIKGSSAWFEVPDTIIGLHREALWKDVLDDKLEAILFKQRYGKWPLTVELDWNSSTGKIGEGRSINNLQQKHSEDLDDVLFASQNPKRYRRRRS